ncbi:signal peptidase I [Serpentinicella alkaliphila]|uniref:signal peptidase I n=1 Tax=Serpentinicella alkaliphila TaxID=1734049 RepID=UPI00201AFCBF|nr:signal peptidase I [Serpentinicella alkaliphila]
MIKPILWSGLIILVWMFPQVRSQTKLKYRENINMWAFNFAVMFILISIVAGLFDGLGKSPYNHSVSGLFFNIIFVVPKLVALEVIRNYIVNTILKEEKLYIFIIIASIITIVSFQLSRILSLEGLDSKVQFVGQYFAPEFCHNLLATYLVFIGGLIPSIIYMGILQGFHWMSPILPDLKWITSALIGILVPMFFLITIQSIHLTQSKKLKRREKTQESPISWMTTSVLSIMIVWFSLGVFPIYPSAVATGSMEPIIYPGDVILVKQNIIVNELQEGDVIQFQRGNILITHRIIDIEEDRGALVGFVTKGDNNSSVDVEIVKPEYVRGKIVKVVPKVGWPTLLFRSRKNVNLDEIVF